MPLTPGQTLTHYEILGPLGAGGMGEVWRARDTRLGREVAIKVLPEHFAEDEERLRRFEREARTLASLSHANLAHVYGIDQVEETCFMAMELVPGEDLAARLARGPLPVDEALDVCRQIAEGLEAAHEAGVVHRDLKPANVRVTSEGMVKILDFGLAKPIHPEATREGTTAAEPDSFLVTEEGLVLGTPTYMSPEQARGRPVDRRTDIWAFGCVLYECLTGERAFGGDSVTDVLAAIVEHEPDWDMLPAGTLPRVRTLLLRCLDKDPRRRLRDIGEARLQLDHPVDDLAEVKGLRSTRRAGAIGVLVGLALGGLAAWSFWPKVAEESGPSRQMNLNLGEPLDDSGRFRRKLALSTDGTLLAYVAKTAADTQIRVHALDRGESWAISDADGAHTPLFSPDGKWVAFFSQGQLKKAPASGGAIVTLCTAPGAVFGGSWADDGTIAFSTNAIGLVSVSSDGGVPETVRVQGFEESPLSLCWPHYLPGSRDLVITSLIELGGIDPPVIATLSHDTGRYDPLVRGADGRYVPSGHLLYQLDGTLFAVKLSRDTLEVSGAPFAISTDVAIDNVGALTAGLSDDGLFICETPAGERENTLLWVDRKGETTLILDTDVTRPFAIPRISPSGDRLLWGGAVADTTGDIWVLDLRRGSKSRVTFESINVYGAWLPDSEHFAFTSLRSGNLFLMYMAGVDDDEPPVRLGKHDVTSAPGNFSPDGSTLLYYEVAASTQRDIWSTPVAGGEPVPVLVTEHNERAPTFSPDGHWFAYVSDESGVDEVYVRRYPVTGTRWRVSIDGGREPAWNPAADELFFRDGDRMMAVEFDVSEDGTTFDPDSPVELFRGSYAYDDFGNANYAVDRDGLRFAMVRGPASSPARLKVVTRWFDELARAERAATPPK